MATCPRRQRCQVGTRGAGTMLRAEGTSQHNKQACCDFERSNPRRMARQEEAKATKQRITVAPSMAIMASTPRPEAAKLFFSLITSKEYLMNSTDSTTPTPPYSLNKERGLDAYQNNIMQLSGVRLYEWNRASVEWWRNLYKDILGTPQGANPMVTYPNPPYKP